MIVKLLNEHHLEFLSLKGGYRGWSESTLVKMSNCWKFHAVAHLGSITFTVLCQALEKPSNGSIQYSTGGHNTIGFVTCSKGFSMVGANTLLCLSNGRWNNSVPTCCK